MQTIEEGWKEFEEMAPPGIDPLIRKMMRGAFYRGAMWLHMQISEGPMITEEQAETFARKLDDDLQVFIETSINDATGPDRN